MLMWSIYFFVVAYSKAIEKMCQEKLENEITEKKGL